jgi:hypothetical protein
MRVDKVDKVDIHSLEKKNNRFISERMNINLINLINPHQPPSTF